MQHERRTNPYPWTWEPVLAVLVAYAIAAWLVLHVTRAVSNLFAGAGWHMTDSNHWIGSTLGILGGNASSGIDPTPAMTASPEALYTWLIVGQLTLLLAGIWGVIVWVRRRGPGRLHGSATATEAEELLGLARLRKNAPIIRPDLHGKKAKS